MKKIAVIIIAALISISLYSLLPIDKDIAKGLAILFFIATLWFTEALNITVTALLVPILAVVTGIFDTKTALSNFAHPVIFLFLGGFALAAALHKQNLDGLFASYLTKLAGRNMYFSVICLFVFTAAMSMWISNTATAAIMLPIALGMISTLREPSPREDAFILLGVAYSANIGGIGTIVGSPPNAITAANLGMSFRDWAFVGVPIVIILLPVIIGLLYIILKPKLDTGTGAMEVEKTVLDKRSSVTISIIFVITVGLWLLSKPISEYMGISTGFDAIVAVLAIVLLVLSNTIRWKEIERFADWGVLLLFGGGLALSAVLSETGASKFLASLLEGSLLKYGVLILLFGAVLLVIFLTEVASNTASAAIMVPIFYAITLDSPELSPKTLALSVGIAASCAFMLPVATPPNALVFGTERIKQRTMMKVGVKLNIVCAVIITLLAYFIL